MMGKMNYKAEYKRAKQQIAELTSQVTTLKDRLDVLRKAKNQTILKTEIVNRNISEPVFGQPGSVPTDRPSTPEQPVEVRASVHCTRDVGVMTTPPPAPAPEPTRPPTKQEPKRFQRKRVKEGWSQCRVYTENKVCQASFVQPCHCEGLSSSPAKSPAVTLPKITTPCSTVGVVTSSPRPSSGIRTISRMKTNEYMSTADHNIELTLLENTFRAEREKQAAIHSKEVGLLKQAIQNLNKSLKSEVEENVKQTIQSPNGSSVFHLYAEEKRRMEEQVRHINQENHKLRTKLKKLEQELRDKDDEMEETEEAIKKHYVDTWDEQYRSWIGKTDKKISFLRSSNENMQTFIMKNARHLPFAATDELKIYNEYGEKVSVFQ